MKQEKIFKHLPTGNIHATALFIDIQNFLGISEILNPKQTSEFIIRVLRPLSNCIREYSGYVCQIQGDAILAVFGVTKDAQNHAANAVRCAIELQKILDSLNPVIIEGFRIPLSADIGICSGEMYACSIHMGNKKEYTVIGKTVNLASRLQKLNRHYNTNILIDEKVFAYIRDDIHTRKIGKLEINGSKERLQAYEVLYITTKQEESNDRTLANYKQGITNFLKENWEEAIRCFSRIEEDEKGYQMIERCKEQKVFHDHFKKNINK